MDYLSSSYLDDKFMKLLNEDICEKVSADKLPNCSKDFLGTMKFGFKAVVVRYFELLRYLGIKYYQTNNFNFINANEFKDISKIK
jgi:hypothetical protein